MKTSVLLVLDTRKPLPDGTCPLILRIVHHRHSSQVPLGRHILPKDWDNTLRKVKSSYRGTESVTRLNNWLQKKKAEALDIVTKLEERKTLDTYSVYELRDMLAKKPETTSFFAFTESVIKSLKEAKRIGNARAYQSTLGVLRSFRQGRDLSFIDLNLAFLRKFETAHLSKGNAHNGLAVYMRTIRAIYNLAIKAGIADAELYPFKHYEIKTTKTRKRAISIDAMKRIIDLKLEPQTQLWHARNYFVASFYMRGISFADLAELRLENIIDGRIFYQRKKTAKPYNIKIMPELQAILDFYLPEKAKRDYLFPIVHQTELETKYKEIMWARKRFNKRLKEIAILCNIEENLTSYVSRHSFATRAKNLGIDTSSISDMLGHGDIKTTQIYLDDLENSLLDDYHEKILK